MRNGGALLACRGRDDTVHAIHVLRIDPKPGAWSVCGTEVWTFHVVEHPNGTASAHFDPDASGSCSACAAMVTGDTS